MLVFTLEYIGVAVVVAVVVVVVVVVFGIDFEF